MIKYLLATHGKFAKGILDSLTMVLGPQEQVAAYCAYQDGETEIKGTVRQYVEGIKAGDELIVVTDVFGGSVNNEFMCWLGHEGFHLVAGLSLPLLIELVMGTGTDTKAMIKGALERAAGSVQYCNLIQAKMNQENVKEDF